MNEPPAMSGKEENTAKRTLLTQESTDLPKYLPSFPRGERLPERTVFTLFLPLGGDEKQKVGVGGSGIIRNKDQN